MNTDLINRFQTDATKAFAFVTSAHNFSEPQIEVDERISFATITFKGQNLAIQLILDERGEDITCKIARVIDGKITKHYARDENKKLVRDSLYSILTRKGIREKLFTQKSKQLSLEQRIPITLHDLAVMLKKHGGEILGDSPDALHE